MKQISTAVCLLLSALPIQTFALTAALQTPAVLNDENLTISLTAHATGMVGTATMLSINSMFGTGKLTTSGTTGAVYSPNGQFSGFYSGQEGYDYFGYCLTDSSKAVSCSYVKVTVFGTGTAPAHNTYYFSPTGNDTSGSGTTANPWQWVGAHHYAPGDVLYLMDGTFVENQPYPSTSSVLLDSAGTATAPIHLACQHALACTIQNKTSNSSGIVIQGGGAYLDIGGLGGIKITSDMTVTPTQTTPPSNPIGNGILLGGNTAVGAIHHISISNNVIYNNGQAGISLSGNFYGTNVPANKINYPIDYITIQRNVVFENSWFSGFHGSGISIYEPIALDTLGGYHIKIIGNVSYYNHDCDSCGTPTDGNGIILDDFAWLQSGGKSYTASALVANNILFGNGGRGIHIFQPASTTTPSSAPTIDVIDNTACGNNNDANIAAGSTYEIGFSAGTTANLSKAPLTGVVNFYNNLAATTRETNLDFQTYLTAEVPAGKYQLPLAQVPSTPTGGLTPSGVGVPAFDPIYGFSGNVANLSAGTSKAMSANTPITLLDPLYAMGEAGNGPPEVTANVYDYNLLSSSYGYFFWEFQSATFISTTTPGTSFTGYHSHNVTGSAPGFSCPTSTSLESFATLVEAVTPSSGSAPLQVGTAGVTPGTYAFPYDINGKMRTATPDIGAVQVSP